MLFRKWWWIVVVVVVVVGIIILFFMRNLRENLPNKPKQFNCNEQLQEYLNYLSLNKHELFQLLISYIVNKDPTQSQAVLDIICSHLNANKTKEQIDEIIQKTMTNVADTIKPKPKPKATASKPKATASKPKAVAADPKAVAADPKAVAEAISRQSIQDYIRTSNVQGCDKEKFETYLNDHPDEDKQVQSLFQNWVNLAGDKPRQDVFKIMLNSKLNAICTASNPDGRTNSPMYNSYAGWLLHQPPELGSSSSMSLSCNPMVLGPRMDGLSADRKAKVYKFLDQVVDEKVPDSQETYDKRASVLSWLCSISEPSDFETAVDKLVQQDPTNVNLDAITPPAAASANFYKVISVVDDDVPDSPPLTEEEQAAKEIEKEEMLKKPPSFDTWIGMNPKSQALFSYYLPCQTEVRKYMDNTTLSPTIYKYLNEDLNASEQVSFFKKLCDQDRPQINNAATIDATLNDYETRFQSYINNSTLDWNVENSDINNYLNTHDRVVFFDNVYNNNLKKDKNTPEQTDEYIKTTFLNKTPDPVKETPAEFKIVQPTSITHIPAINNHKTYVLKGYLGADLEIPVSLSAAFSFDPRQFKNRTASMYYDGFPMDNPDAGINDMRVQSAFRQYFTDTEFLNIPMLPSVKEASMDGFPYYVLFISDDSGACMNVIALGITEYSKLISTPRLMQSGKVKRDGVYQSVWILDDVDNAMKQHS